MLLAELIAAPDLGLRPLHVMPGSLERPIGRVITTDLIEPGRYLTGGELILSGLVWRQDAADSETFVRSISSRGSTTLLAGRQQFGEIPADLIDACKEHGITLVEVAAEVPFADITEYIARIAAGTDRAAASLMRQRDLLAAMASGYNLGDLTSRVAAEIGRDCAVLTPSGRAVAAGPQAFSDPDLDAISRTFLSAPALPALTQTEAGPVSLFMVGAGLEQRLTAWILAVTGDHAGWHAGETDAVRELASIAALDRGRRTDAARVLRSVADDVLALVDAGALSAEVAARLQQAGLDPHRPLVAMVAEVEKAGPNAWSLIEDVALGIGQAVLSQDHDGLIVALVQAEDESSDVVGDLSSITGRLRNTLRRVGAGMSGARACIGLSGHTGIDAVAGAIEEARFAHRAARASAEPIAIVGSDEVTSHVLLLATVPDEVRRTFARRVLGPVIAYDERTGADLIATLTTFLDCAGSWARTAEAMHLHVNTVRYRIEKIEELTDRDLSQLEDRVDVFLALRSRK